MGFEIELQKGFFFFLFTKLANINKILILPYIAMLFGNNTHALLLEMENDRLFQGKNSTMCLCDVSFYS